MDPFPLTLYPKKFFHGHDIGVAVDICVFCLNADTLLTALCRPSSRLYDDGNNYSKYDRSQEETALVSS